MYYKLLYRISLVSFRHAIEVRYGPWLRELAYNLLKIIKF